MLAILRTQNQPQEVSCVFLEVEHLFLSVGCARSKLLSRTVLQSLKSFSPDAGLRMEELLALDLWDIVIEVLRSTNNIVQPSVFLSFKNRGQKVKRRQKVHQLPDVDYMRPQTHILLKMSLSCTPLRTVKL